MGPQVNNKRDLFIYGFVLTTLVGVTIGLFNQTTAELSNRHVVREAFRELSRLDRNLDENVLRARAYQHQNFDSIAYDMQEIESTCRQIQNPTGPFAQAADSETFKTAAEACRLLAQKTEAVEKFKSKSAILHNSLEYLPELARQANGTRDESNVQKLLSQVLQYGLTAADDDEKALTKEIRTFELSRSHRVPGDSWSNGLLMHSKLVLHHTREREEIQKEGLSDQFSNFLADMEDRYAARLSKNDSVAGIVRSFLVFVCLILAGSQFFLFRRLVRASTTLSDLNNNLEGKVEVRTQELSEALKKLSEQQQIVAQSMKMTALGEMAGGVAHEINTPLGAILLNAEILRDLANEPDNGVEVATRADSIIRVVQRISKIILGLRKFSRDNRYAEKVPTKIEDIISDTLSFCQEKFIKHSISLSTDLTPGLEARVISEQISQVLLNLLSNAADALCLPDGPAEKWIRIESRTRPGFTEILVTDSGSGIPPAVRDKMMQPFFTTKDVGKGTGLGLSISQGIAENHGGSLNYDGTCPNTRFILTLPEQKATEAA